MKDYPGKLFSQLSVRHIEKGEMPKVFRTLKLYRRIIGFSGLVGAIREKITRSQILLQVRRSDIKHPFFIRIPSSDVLVVRQIFKNYEYRFNVKRNPRVIIDAGANTGLSSIYLSNKFPYAKIIAIEPEINNFNMLKMNVGPYVNIVPVCAALWHKDTIINLIDPGEGEWGFVAHSPSGSEANCGKILHETRGITIDMLMKKHDIGRIDILKIDIEGAEREVFMHSSSWIEKVDSLIIELHESKKAGCNRSFYNATNGFDDEWLQGENVYLTRRDGCIIKGDCP